MTERREANECKGPVLEVGRVAVLPWMALLLGLALPVNAHNPGLSAAALRLEKTNLLAHLTLARADVETLLPLDADRSGSVSAPEFEANREALEELAFRALEIENGTNRALPYGATVEMDDSDGIHFHLEFPTPSGPALRGRSTLLQFLPGGHKQYLTLRDDRNRLLGETMLDATRDTFDLPLARTEAAGESPGSFGQFLWLGVEHIVTGYDHLVFLLGLLIVGGNFRSVVKIITSFTIAHSLTLALATLDLIRIPSRIIEPLIALSIIYVGIENLFHRNLNWRWLLAFGFGLVHGCGFASVLRELGLGSSGAGVAMPLFSFNLGVEAGQLAIAAVVLPCIWRLKQRPSFQIRYVPACSVLIAVAGGYWLVERTLLS